MEEKVLKPWFTSQICVEICALIGTAPGYPESKRSQTCLIFAFLLLHYCILTVMVLKRWYNPGKYIKLSDCALYRVQSGFALIQSDFTLNYSQLSRGGFDLRYLKSDEYSTESKHLPTLPLYLPRQKGSLGKIISQNSVEAGWFSTIFNTHVYLKAHNTNQKWFSSQTEFPLILCCLKTEHTGGLRIYENRQTGVHWGQLLWPFQQAKKKKKLRLLSS